MWVIILSVKGNYINWAMIIIFLERWYLIAPSAEDLTLKWLTLISCEHFRYLHHVFNRNASNIMLMWLKQLGRTTDVCITMARMIMATTGKFIKTILLLCLVKHHAMKPYRGVKVTILDLGFRWRFEVSFTHQGQCGCCGIEKNSCLF